MQRNIHLDITDELLSQAKISAYNIGLQATDHKGKDIPVNPKKFPERFSWKLTSEESIETRGGRYKNPRVFTEQGVAMLATILKSKIAF